MSLVVGLANKVLDSLGERMFKRNRGSRIGDLAGNISRSFMWEEWLFDAKLECKYYLCQHFNEFCTTLFQPTLVKLFCEFVPEVP